jgi:hypothetical protein
VRDSTGGLPMRSSIGSILFAFFVLASPTFAQHGTAENGYYPAAYYGDTWTGVVVSANEQTGEITLSYTNGGKTQTFVGVPEIGYLVHEHNGSTRPLKMSDIPVGRTVKVWYVSENKKVDDHKVKVNAIFLIDVLANAKKTQTYFKAF